MLTCKQFLQELNEYLDPSIDPETKRHLESHVTECPNCFVIVDTTRKTLQVYKGVNPQPVPEDLKNRLWEALERKMAARKKAQSS
ncbi:MAG TPA: zf-HC2 domain-containing protein [Bryobacteraceae bacterium]|nr:zf-HC2 domain-containing protein [Bryobacteraceae bacterium]